MDGVKENHLRNSTEVFADVSKVNGKAKFGVAIPEYNINYASIIFQNARLKCQLYIKRPLENYRQESKNSKPFSSIYQIFSLYLLSAPVHKGIEGNETADKLTTVGTTLSIPYDFKVD